MELGIEAARWVVGKALGPVSSGLLEAWAASTELGTNMKDLKMELLYAEGMLNNARGHYGHGPGIKNLALSELLHELRYLAYRADDALDEVDYFRIQDELEGTNHTADEHDGGCLRNHVLHAHQTARAIAKRLGFSKCSGCFASHSGEPVEDTRTRVPCGGHWPCCGVKTCDDDDDEQQEDPSQGGVLCGAVWPRGRTSSTSLDRQAVGSGCMGRITSAARDTIHSVGKHFPCCSVSTIQNVAANSSGHRFFCCARPNKAPQRVHVVETPKLKFYRAELSQKMKDIVDQLKPLCAKVSTILNLELLAARPNNNGQDMVTRRPITTSESIEPEFFYGREDKTNELIHDITKGKYHHMDLTVLPIVGPGGIGKTTFTQHICKKLHDHFEVKLWVCVSVSNFNVSRLLQEIADKKEIADKIKKEENASPEKRIEEGLKSKRFLLVLDDIWGCSNEDDWNRFLVPFKKGQTKGSVILVTTRFPAVAQKMVKTTDHWIDLKGIDEKAFKELFFEYVFGKKQPPEDHSELLRTGDEIIKKLKGSPLAAKTVGRLLRNQLDLGHWTRVLESREWESQSGDHEIMPALKLSFDYLPFHLQQCFSYCSLFPEDYRFSEEEIIHFWIGLDILHSRGENKKIEDIGQSYLVELVSHGFFKKEKEDGHTYYVLHDLMHELGLKVSADECLSAYSSNVRSIQILPSIRHLSINIDDSSVNDRKAFDTCKEDFSVLGERVRVENIHSLMLFGGHQGSFAKTFHDLFSKAKSLRAILVSGDFYNMEDFLNNFSELIHLRYLRVLDNDEYYQETNKLIASNNISRFYHMRVLDLRGCQDYRNLPSYISNLVKLRHFLVDDNDSRLHSRISKVGKMKSLQELKRFEVGEESPGFKINQIGHLLELCGSLWIGNLENVKEREEADEAKLVHKRNLKELILNWSSEHSNSKDTAHEEQVLEGLKPHSNLQKLSIIGHSGGTCPSWLGVNPSVQNLESLCLDGVNWDTFPPIGELQLVNKGLEEKLSSSPGQHFKNLKSIQLANLERLERWVVGSSGQLLYHLKELIIKGCPELMELQFSDCNHSQQDLKTWPPNLCRLEIQDCPKLFSLPPVPWTRSPCSIEISEVGLGFKELTYGEAESLLALKITGDSTQDSALFWTSLDFDSLAEVKKLDIAACPPLALDDLQKLSLLKHLSISYCDNAFGPVEDGRHAGYQFAVESMEVRSLGATSGKELTQVLSSMPMLSELRIRWCDKITGVGVVEQKQHEEAANSRSRDEEEIDETEEGLLLLPPQLHNLSIDGCRELRLLRLQTLSSSCSSLQSLFLHQVSFRPHGCLPFPSSLQSLFLCGVEMETLPPLSNLASLASLRILDCRGDARGLCFGSLLAHGCLQELLVTGVTNFFNSIELSIPSSRSMLLSSLATDDVAGALAAPICRVLSSSLTRLRLRDTKEMESLTGEQEEALQLLSSLEHLQFWRCAKLQGLPAGLHRLTSLKTLEISYCPSIRLLPTKDGLPASLQNLTIYRCSAIRSLPKDGLPDSLQNLTISYCSAIRSLPKDGLPASLQQLEIYHCPSIRALPKGDLPASLKLIEVRFGNSEELKRQCRKLIGSTPIVRVEY